MSDLDVKRLLNKIKREDDQIILEEPLILNKYGREFVLKEVNWFYKWNKLAGDLGIFIAHYTQVCGAMGFPKDGDDLIKFRDNIRFLISNKASGKDAFKLLVRIVKRAGLKGIGWMKRHFNISDWVELLMYIYMANCFSVKKNLKKGSRLLMAGRAQSA